MAVESLCPNCGAVSHFTTDLNGEQVQCDECANTFVTESRSTTNTNDGRRPEESIKEV